MKAKYPGPLSIDDFFQALFQDKSVFCDYGIKHLKSATVYFTPCDEYGRPVQIIDSQGYPVDGFVSGGAYKCAADAFDAAQELEAKPVTRPASPNHAPLVPF